MARAPIHIDSILPAAEEDKRPRTRCGYLVPEAFNSYTVALGEVGSVASGKALHFAADLVCSGGIDIWIRAAYTYSIQHIGLANPRIFVYLRGRISELDKKLMTLPQESFYNNPDVQNAIAETVLVLQLCPKRTKVPWPKVDPSTKRPGWLRGMATSPETRATRAVWSSEGDTTPMYVVANEFCQAVQQGASERALFWTRWLLEEDSRIRKETKGNGLTTKERGSPSASPKSRTDVGHFIAALLMEIYKELAAANQVRMHEEFGELQRLWRGGEQRMASSLRREALGLLIMICCEVPRWKVPATPVLVQDPVRLSRAVGQSWGFFNEVLGYKPLAEGKQLKPTMTRNQKKVADLKVTEKDKKGSNLDDHFQAYDAAMEAYLNRQ
jgi:hypothetical protein